MHKGDTQTMQDFKKLRVWQHAHQFTLALYDASSTFPRSEKYGLTSQLRRAAVSIPSNIAEGAGRGSNPDFLRFLYIAMGSASETAYQPLLAKDLDFLEEKQYQELRSDLTSIRRMLNAFIQKLET